MVIATILVGDLLTVRRGFSLLKIGKGRGRVNWKLVKSLVPKVEGLIRERAYRRSGEGSNEGFTVHVHGPWYLRVFSFLYSPY